MLENFRPPSGFLSGHGRFGRRRSDDGHAVKGRLVAALSGGVLAHVVKKFMRRQQEEEGEVGELPAAFKL